MLRYFLYLQTLITIPCISQSNDSLTVEKDLQNTLDSSLYVNVDGFEKKVISLYEKLYLFSKPNRNLDYSLDSVPEFEDSIIEYRVKILDEKSPFNFKYNAITAPVINFYINKKRYLTSKMLGASSLYFPLFEEALAKHNLPEELKYLPIVESALNPTATSRSGARGLWQFMPQTAKMMGLTISSYVDERCDPIKSTEAACLYLKYLYSIYNDWSISLAAYNAGPGNINKAIRRSGGKASFWELRSYLPKETQNYVPTFIAVNYMMEFAKDHNIQHKVPDFLFFEIDTIQVDTRMNFNVLEQWLCFEKNKLEFLNPIYINNIIPKTEKKQTLTLPSFLIGDFIMLEDSISKYSSLDFEYSLSASENKNASEVTYYTIKSGDTIWDIAQMHEGLSVSDIKKINADLDVYKLKAGSKIKIINYK